MAPKSKGPDAGASSISRAKRTEIGEESCPEAGGRVHFSGALMHDTYVHGHVSVPFVEDMFSEYVGVGRYPDNNLAFPNSISHTFDSVAVDAGTRVTIYSERDFKGKVLWDRVGPAIVVNVRWRSDTQFGGKPYSEKLREKWTEKIQSIFPPEVREFSTSDMHQWNTGSLVIQGEQGRPWTRWSSTECLGTCGF